MHRVIEHRGEAHRSFRDVLHIVERHPSDLLEAATDAAAAHSVELVLASDRRLPTFDHAEPLVLIVGGGAHRPDEYAAIDVRWSADRRKRLLANVAARLELRPVGNPRHPGTEVVLRSDYAPVEGIHGPEAALFGRRVVVSALGRFHREVIRFLEDYEESAFIAPAASGGHAS